MAAVRRRSRQRSCAYFADDAELQLHSSPNNTNPTPDQTLTRSTCRRFRENWHPQHRASTHDRSVGKIRVLRSSRQARREPVDMTQINLESGRSSRSPTRNLRTPAGGRSRKAIDRVTVWLSARDDQPAAGSAQRARRRRRRHEAMADYGRPKNMVSAETSGVGTPVDPADRRREPWEFVMAVMGMPARRRTWTSATSYT